MFPKERTQRNIIIIIVTVTNVSVKVFRRIGYSAIVSRHVLSFRRIQHWIPESSTVDASTDPISVDTRWFRRRAAPRRRHPLHRRPITNKSANRTAAAAATYTILSSYVELRSFVRARVCAYVRARPFVLARARVYVCVCVRVCVRACIAAVGRYYCYYYHRPHIIYFIYSRHFVSPVCRVTCPCVCVPCPSRCRLSVLFVLFTTVPFPYFFFCFYNRRVLII